MFAIDVDAPYTLLHKTHRARLSTKKREAQSTVNKKEGMDKETNKLFTIIRNQQHNVLLCNWLSLTLDIDHANIQDIAYIKHTFETSIIGQVQNRSCCGDYISQ